MNKIEARAVLAVEMAKYEQFPYEQLRSMVGVEKLSYEVLGASGTRYYVDVRATWDGKPSGDLRVICNVDDGGWRAYFPMTASFIKEQI